MRRFAVVFGLLSGVLACGRGAEPPGAQAPSCTLTGRLMRLADLPEASGLAVSRATPGAFWSHNDSGPPVLFALDAGGRTVGRVRLSGASLEDWEAIASGPCPSGWCLYVADIGDNNARRPHITIYRLPEPPGVDGTAHVTDVFHASYPDGAHDAETLLVTPDGALFIVTKGDTGPIALYTFPRQLETGTVMRLERVGEPISVKPPEKARITDGTISADGERVLLRTRSALVIYPAAEFLRGDFSGGRMFDLTSIGEPQGEGLAVGADGVVYVAGEGGGKGFPGTLAALSCPE
jgi:hypothetical protein